MSIMKSKLRRSAVVVAFSLGAFQALSIVGANVASADVTTVCSFSGGVLTLGIDATTATSISQDVAKNILVDTDLTSTLGGTCATSAAANVGNTTAINITGPAGASSTDETLTIVTDDRDFAAPTGVTISYGTINWTVNLGNNATTTPGDTFMVDNATSTTAGVKTDWGVNGVDLNGDGDLDVVLAGIETSEHDTGIGKVYPAAGTTVNAGGSTITGAAYATAITIDGTLALSDNTLTGGAGSDTILGGGGDDYIAGGLGNDSLDGNGGEDAADYSASATAVVVTLGGATPGVGSGEGLDSLVDFEDIVGSSHGDTLTGDGDDNVFYAGNGADTIAGGGDSGLYGDTYDTAAAEAGVTVDIAAGTSTGGSGTDKLSGIENASGSDFDDSIKGSSGNNLIWGEDGNDTLSGGAGDRDGVLDQFDGGGGIDVLDYGTNTLSTTVKLWDDEPCADLATGAVCSKGNGVSGGEDWIRANSVENVILGTGNDTFTGSSFNNQVWPNGGQNSLNGCPDAVQGCGIDTVNYNQGYDAGVTVNLAGGGPTSGNADSIQGFTNAVGTAFADDIIGTDANVGNSLKGQKGNDSISGNNGPDFVLGGAGNDAIRGGGGEDSLKGQGGKDNIRGSGGGDNLYGGKGKDFCDGGGGSDLIKTCEKPKDKHGHWPERPRSAPEDLSTT